MEKTLERLYTDFEHPPIAPTYHPTEEEFADPISFVAKIRAEAEKYGIVKIVPPATFRPPFCIDPATFEFVPRVQRLNEIDALFRLRIIFINKLVHFWKYSKGQQFRIPYIDNKYIDLYRLRQLVDEEGGLKRVNDTRRWAHIAKALGFRGNAGPTLKQCYTRWVHPFEQSLGNRKEAKTKEEAQHTNGNELTKEEREEEEPVEGEKEKGQDKNETGKDEKDGAASTSTSPQTRSQTRMISSRMMAGSGKKSRAKPVPSLDKSSIQSHKSHKTPIELVVCARCGNGEDEARLLLCETCDASMHTYCAKPPLANVPKGEWRCSQCVANVVKTVAMDFGFTDSNQRFTLETFGEWANLFKQQYFNQAPRDVPSEHVEREFWRNVIDIDKGVQVKYGADLISSKVGSGFPRREDISTNFRGPDARERQLYANHPWNLNNLPKVRESVLCHMNMDISGMMVPWIYMGMLFSTFCWHVEDHWTYSINYNHWGERKIWYGIPGDDAEKFDELMKESAPELFTEQRDLLHHMITHMNPSYLVQRGLRVYTVRQNAGEFVITLPRAYHAGFNEGLNFAEAVNFAPPDWLKMGRLCLENYASVGRNCVFAHEELVMKMVSVSHKMSIGMCLATLEELSWIVGRETEFRRRLSNAGVHESVFCRFEDIPDDARSCAVCRTTLFCSGLVCRHEGRIVCSQHVNELCPECRLDECCLKFRYTLEDLVPLVRRLTERTNAFFEWRQAVAELYARVKDIGSEEEDEDEKKPEEERGNPEEMPSDEKGAGKIDVVQMRSLAEQWRSSRFPHCEEIQRINQVLAKFERTAATIRKVLNRKIRLRDQTRCQKADTRWEYSEVTRLRRQLAASVFEDKELEAGIGELCQRVENWKGRAEEAMSRGFEGGRSTVDTLYSLIAEAEEEFNVKLEAEGLDRLKTELMLGHWLIKANKILEQIERKRVGKKEEEEAIEEVKKERTNNDDEEDDDEMEDEEECGETEKRVDLQHLADTIADAAKWRHSHFGTVSPICEQLENLHKRGTEADGRAAKFLETAEKAKGGVGFERAQAEWERIIDGAGGDWVHSRAMDTFRAELKVVQKMHQRFGQLECSAFSLRNLEQLEHLCGQSLFERDGRRHAQIREWLDGVQKFVERIRTIFQKAVSYYNTFDIIAGRSDLPALIEGEPLPLALFNSTKYSDNWHQLRAFASRDQLITHLHAIADQQCTLLHALRLTNAERSPKETCCCGRDEGPPKTTKNGGQTGSNSRGSQQNGNRKKSTGSGSSNTTPTMVNGRRRTTEPQQQAMVGKEKLEAEGTEMATTTMMIPCFVCNANFHATCAQWDPFMARLPAGVFLCQRCLRSRRPCIEDLEAAYHNSKGVPDNCFERILVQNLIQRATHAFAQLQRLLHSIPESAGTGGMDIDQTLQTSLKEWLTMALSLEVMDTEVYEALAASTYFDLFPLPEGQKRIWQQIRDRMVDAEPAMVIFAIGTPLAITGACSSGSPSASASGSRRSATNSGAKRRSGGGEKQKNGGKSGDGKQKRRRSNKETEVAKKKEAEEEEAEEGRMMMEEEMRKTTMDEGEGDEHGEEEDEAGSSSKKHPEKCAADFCLRPYSEFTRWIQCEAGCARWYHFCCVGISVRGAQLISAYCCYKCATKSAAAGPSAAAATDHPPRPTTAAV